MRNTFTCTLTCLTTLLFAAPSHAAPVALDTVNTSTLTATVTELAATDPSNTENVTALPYTSPITESDELETATVTPALGTNGFDLSFALSATDTGSSDEGAAALFFIPGPNVQFMLAGAAGSNSNADTIYASIYDLATNTYLYSETVSGGSPLFLNTDFNPLTGPLTAGDTYEFQTNTTLAGGSIDAVAIAPQAALPTYALTGTVNLTFTQTPEPSAAALLLFATLPALRRARRSPRSIHIPTNTPIPSRNLPC